MNLKEKLKLFVRKIFDIFFCAFPMRNIVLFESNPDFEDNTYWFYKYCVEQKQIQKKYKLIWLIADNNNKTNELCGAKIKCIHNCTNNLFVKLQLEYYKH